MDMKMGNKVAIVTGGAMGYKTGGTSIGGAISIRLANDGYKVVVVDLGEMGERTVELIKKDGGEALFVTADVTATDDVKRIIDTAKSKYGGLSCLVNCVAYYSSGMSKNVADISEEEWNKTLEVNLNGYFKMAKYSIPLMLESGGGTIVNISSIAAFNALPNFSVYSVTKAAILALTRTIAVDFAPKIRANAVCPGFVKIANSENNRTPEELEKWYKDIAKQYPMRRVCEVDEIANVVSFLTSDESSYINGQSIIVDGGKIVADSHEF
ncbi:MAG: short-chain family oxidoreductase [Candidatus Daviesbacteria bacterium GW2011_GWA1_38_7]|nr:MAG: short-chain family oxidoreductase [Candidatus Daviesbacteria bacterium GW2011_GWA1_38_7]